MDEIKHKILIVEDDRGNQFLLAEYFSNYTFETKTVSNGIEAIEFARKYKPDLILMDIELPIMDGMESAKLIKADPELDKIPIIGITALILSKDEKEQAKSVFDLFTTKPIDFDTFHLTVKDLIQNHPA